MREHGCQLPFVDADIQVRFPEFPKKVVPGWFWSWSGHWRWMPRLKKRSLTSAVFRALLTGFFGR
jgi:hypothetical protein